MAHIKTAMLQRETSAIAMAKQLKRIVVNHENAFVEDELTIHEFLNKTEQLGCRLIITDSIQSLKNDFPELSADGAAQEIYNLVRAWCRKTGGVCILISQVNKDGSSSSKGFIKHLVDAHLEMQYDAKKNIRYFRCTKSRLGGKVGELMFYRFTENEDIMEFSDNPFVNDASKLQTLDQHVVAAMKTYLKGLNNKALANTCYDAIEEICKNCQDDRIVILRAIQAINNIVDRHDQLKKIA
jgi:predicted ATP-dependent serine protease